MTSIMLAGILVIMDLTKEEAIMNEIIEVTQLPIIKQNLLSAKETVLNRINAVKDMAITEDTRKEAKAVRAQLNKEKAEFDSQLKAVKAAVMQPYEELLVTYNDCITRPYSEADSIFKTKISEIENGLKNNKAKEVEDYFNEYAVSINLDFVKFSDVPINITLNSSMKSLKATVKEFLDRLAAEMESLLSMDNKEELFAEYMCNGYNLALAITTVDNRHKKIESERAKVADAIARKKQEEEAAKKVAEVIVPFEVLSAPVEIKDEITNVKTFKAVFSIEGISGAYTKELTLEGVRAMKRYLESEGFIYD